MHTSTLGPLVPLLLSAAASLLAVPARSEPLPQVIHPEATAGAAAQRGRDGHFWFPGTVNGTALPMLFDTGATFVSLRAEDAARAGIDPAGLHYTLRMTTPNGTTEAAPVTLASVTVGSITAHGVRAVVGKPGTMPTNLLGQSFLSHVAFRQDGDRLMLLDR